jgi:hypothetical protein
MAQAPGISVFGVGGSRRRRAYLRYFRCAIARRMAKITIARDRGGGYFRSF